MAEMFTQGFALAIGVGADLPYTVDDANALANILTDPGRCAYPESQVNLLVSEAATRDNILSALDRLAEINDPEATVTIYFSGHGQEVILSSDTASTQYYLIPYNCDRAQLNQTAISGQEFAQKLRAIRAKKLLILLDCCHAGGVGNAKDPEPSAPLPPEALKLFQAGRGRVVIASCKQHERSYPSKRYSAFTSALIQALCGQGVAIADGYVRVGDIALHCREEVPRLTQHRQHPIIHWEESDNFIVAYYASGQLKPKRLPDEFMEVETPETKPEPKTEIIYNQSGQTVKNQTNIQGGVHLGSGSTVNFGISVEKPKKRSDIVQP
jgi:uncharacterized caspase-like protein